MSLGASMEFCLLGPVEAHVTGIRINLGPRQQRLVFAVLALELNQVVPTDRLTEITWSQTPPRTARHALHVIISRLRSILTDAVELAGVGGGYVLRADPTQFDVYRFRDLQRRARATSDPYLRIDLLDRALALWSGPALHDTAPASAAESLCRGLEEARLSAVEDRIAASLAIGHHHDLLETLPRLVADHPLRERLLALYMLALHHSGRSAEALHLYRQARARLADDLGIQPGADLRALEIAILRGDLPLENFR